MAKYRLEGLLSARRVKEDRFAREARQATQAVVDAEAAEAAARDELERYRAWRPGEEKRLFEEVRGHILSQDELDRHRDDVDELKRRELRLEEALEEAGQAVLAAKEEEARAKQRLAEAIKDRQKIEEHRQRWWREEQKRIEMAEEAELEDFKTRTLPDDDESEVFSEDMV